LSLYIIAFEASSTRTLMLLDDITARWLCTHLILLFTAQIFPYEQLLVSNFTLPAGVERMTV